MNLEWVHIGLMVGYYVIMPLGIWAAHSYKRSIINELKRHVDTTIKAHEDGESNKFKDLSDRIGRIEDVLLRRSSAARRPSGASGRKRKG